jgi:hypothetical protein
MRCCCVEVEVEFEAEAEAEAEAAPNVSRTATPEAAARDGPSLS